MNEVDVKETKFRDQSQSEKAEILWIYEKKNNYSSLFLKISTLIWKFQFFSQIENFKKKPFFFFLWP